ncbi:MAG: hypothetical protein P8123_04285 [bacterium]
MNINTTRYTVPLGKKRGGTRSYDKDKVRHPDRRRKRKRCTKAELKQRLRAHLVKALAQIDVVNRIDIIPEKKTHLERAIIHLEAVCVERPGSHLIKQQLALCRELLWDIERGAPDCRCACVEVMIDGE